MSGALTGFRVLDLSDSIAGQFCCRMLADYGAVVILAEQPDGTATRRMPPLRDDGGSVLFEHLNIGKRSVVIEGLDALVQLAPAATSSWCPPAPIARGCAPPAPTPSSKRSARSARTGRARTGAAPR